MNFALKTILTATLLTISNLYISHAQESMQDSLQHVSQVSIIGTKSKWLPGSGERISRLQLSKLNQPNVNNVLRNIAGVNVRDEEGFGLRPNIGMRGTAVNRSAKITLMEDGILIAPAPYADPSAYYFPTFSRMQGVEVLKGSSQIKYGPYTIGGALNLISSAIPQHFKGFAQLSYGSFGTNQQRIWIGDSKEHVDYLFEVNRIASNGFKQLDNGANTGFDRRDVLGKVRWHTSDKVKVIQSVTLKFLSASELGNESYLGLTYNDYKANPLRRYAATQADLLDLKHNHISLSHVIAPAKGLSITTTAYYSHTFRDWARVNTVGGKSLNTILSDPNSNLAAYQIMTGTDSGAVEFQNAARTYTSRGIQSHAEYQFQTHKIYHTLNAGFRYHKDEADRWATKSNYIMNQGIMIQTGAGPKGNAENQVRAAEALSMYMSYDIRYKNLKVSPGLRYETINLKLKNYGIGDPARLGTSLVDPSNKISILLPGIGATYEINNHMNVFGGVHKGFSPPGAPSSTTTEQASVETAISYELGYRYEAYNLQAQAVAFANNYDNILGSDNVSGGGAGTGNMFNAGNASVKGFELSLHYQLLKANQSKRSWSIPLQLAYTYTDARFMETFKNAGGDWGSGVVNKGDLIPFITPHMLSGSIGLDHPKYNVVLSTRYIGNTRVKPSQGEQIVPNEQNKYAEVNTVEQYLILDFSANWHASKYLSLFTTINNMTNSKAIVANLPQGYRPIMPLSLQGGVKINF